MAILTIGSRLPHGLILEVGNESVEIKGLNTVRLIGADYNTTQVDSEFWKAWTELNPKFPALENMALFAVKNETEAKSAAKEAKGAKTGLEGLDPASHGVKPADKE